ncbi:Uncharacterized protein QTN25_001373 [Entamoeba marina]
MDTKHTIRKSSEDILRSKERKRNNRVNANKNDYGNEGFLLMILFYLGCEIHLRRPQKDGLNQKFQIISIVFGGIELLNRQSIENMVNNTEFPPESNLLRIKKTIVNITIDNSLLDILRDYFLYEFEDTTIKSPQKSFMPERRILKHIELNELWDKPQIIEKGVLFYESVKQNSGDSTMIHLFNRMGDNSTNSSIEGNNTVSCSLECSKNGSEEV